MPFDTRDEWEQAFPDKMKAIEASEIPTALDKALRDETWKDVALKWAEENYAGETAHFLVAYAAKASGDSINMADGEELFDHYVRDGAPEMLNLSSGVRDKMTKTYNVYRGHDTHDETEEGHAQPNVVPPPDHFKAVHDDLLGTVGGSLDSQFTAAARKVHEHMKTFEKLSPEEEAQVKLD